MGFFNGFATGFLNTSTNMMAAQAKEQADLDAERQKQLTGLDVSKQLYDYQKTRDLQEITDRAALAAKTNPFNAINQTNDAIANAPKPVNPALAPVPIGTTTQTDDNAQPFPTSSPVDAPDTTPTVDTGTQTQPATTNMTPTPATLLPISAAPAPPPAGQPTSSITPDSTTYNVATDPVAQKAASDAYQAEFIKTGSAAQAQLAGAAALDKYKKESPEFQAQEDFNKKKATLNLMVQNGADPATAKEQIFGKAALTKDELGTQDLEDIKARQNLGLLKDLPTRELTKSQAKDVDSLVMDANKARIASIQGINTINSVLGISEDLSTGPLATSMAKIQAGFAQLTDTQVADKVNEIYVLNKDQIQATNAQMKALGNVRPGIGIAQLEKAGVPGSDMPRDARIRVAEQLLGTLRANVNHADALTSGVSDRLDVNSRIKFANEHDDANPSLLGDGKTLNPNFVDFKTWRFKVADGSWFSSTTGNDVRGAKGKVTTSNVPEKPTLPTVTDKASYDKIPSKGQYTDPEGNIRTKP